MINISFIFLSFDAVISDHITAKQVNFSGSGYVCISKSYMGEMDQEIKLVGAKASATILCTVSGDYFELELVYFPDSDVLTTHVVWSHLKD